MAARGVKKKGEEHPQDQLADLEAALRRDGLAKGYCLRGPERYFRDRALDAIRRRAEEEGLEVRVHDADDPDFEVARLVDELSGGDLFAERLLVVARNVEEALAKQDGEKSAATRAIEAFLAADAGVVVVSAASLRADHSVVKAVQAAGGLVFTSRRLYDSPPPWIADQDPRRAELVLWLQGRARELGLRLTPDQALYVCAATGNDLFALEDQLAKLRTAPPGSEVGRLVAWEAALAPWDVAGAMIEGDLARALGGIEALFRSGFGERDGRRTVDTTALTQILTGSLVGGVRKGLAITSAIARGASPVDAAHAAGVAGAPAVVQREIERARARAAGQWRSMLADLGDLERRAKSTAGVEVDDFTLLAVRWRAPATRRADSPGARAASRGGRRG